MRGSSGEGLTLDVRLHVNTQTHAVTGLLRCVAADDGDERRRMVRSGLPRLLAGLGRDRRRRDAGRRIGPSTGRCRRSPGAELIDLVERSGLRGRGGADFPTAIKLRAVARRRRRATLVVNGAETEPASAKDRLLLTRLPHLVLDGAVLAARTVGAREAIVKSR